MTKRKILFVSYSGPCPPRDGKRQRTYALLKALANEFSVDYLILAYKGEYELATKEYDSPDVNFLFCPVSIDDWFYKLTKKIGIEFIKNAGIENFITRLLKSNSYAFVFSRYIHPATSLPKDSKIICDIDDDYFEVNSYKIKNERHLLGKLRKIALSEINSVRYRILLKRIKLALYSKDEVGMNKLATVLPNLPFQLLTDNNFMFAPATGSSILFVGKLSYGPNLNGIKWFIKEVWPILEERIAGVKLSIVSHVNTHDIELKEMLAANENIILKINIAKIEDCYKRHSLVVVPVSAGGGSSIKVAEALLMGRSVITTPFGARGYDKEVTMGFVTIHSSPIDFCNSIVSALSLKNELIEKQERIFQWAITEYALDKWEERFMKLIYGSLN